MNLDPDYVLKGLLQHNYLPVQTPYKDEMPPMFSTLLFTPDVARLLANQKRRDGDYNTAQYRLTRYNGVSRTLSIPHPYPYCRLVLCMYENWAQLDYTAGDAHSLSRPQRHADGRVVLFEYGTWRDRTSRELRPAFGKRFLVRTDVSSCYPSIYTHALPWALVGKEEAKRNQKKQAMWYNELDMRVRSTKRGETKGLLIGPGTSSLLCEAVLARVDEALCSQFTFNRFVDDYSAYCDSEQQAYDFLRRLADELETYRLELNILKTKVLRLPQPTTAPWISSLSLALPREDTLDEHACVCYLNHAAALAKDEPDGSVLKYALRTLVHRRLARHALDFTLRYALNLAYHQPCLLPVLRQLLHRSSIDGTTRYAQELCAIAMENAASRRSDGMVWALYYMLLYQVAPPDCLVEAVLASEDCLALCALWPLACEVQRSLIVDFANRLLKQSLPDLDEYWPLLYVLYCDDAIANPYADDHTFHLLKSNGVRFMHTAAGRPR